jgi:hypothetical protein
LSFFFACDVPFLGSTVRREGTSMLEALVPARIRRTLLEYVLAHPRDRFYLRGLAKELGLAVSPLRRELKRLERSGMLRAMPEGTMVFYTANPASPDFQRLQQVGQLPSLAAPPAAGLVVQAPPAGRPLSAPLPVGVIMPSPASTPAAPWRRPLPKPLLVGLTGAGLVLLLVAGLTYLTLTNQRLARRLDVRQAGVTVVVPQPSTSGAMRGSRWQIVPGGFGGFSSPKNSEAF